MAFCKNAWTAVKKWFKKVDSFLLSNSQIAVEIVGKIKQLLSSPTVDMIAAVIPGDKDDLFIAVVRKALEFSLDKLIMFSDCAEKTTVEEKLLCYAKFLRNLPKEIRDAQLFKLASLITKELDNNRHDQSDYDLIVQSVYTASK